MTVHWWNTGNLAGELALDTVSEAQCLAYAMINVMLITISLYYAYWFGTQRGWMLFIEFAIVCVVALIGLNECFKANGGSGGADFLKRLVCLGVPVGLKFAVIGIVAAQLFYFGMPRIAASAGLRNSDFAYELGTLALVSALTAGYYWRLARHMARIAKPGQSGN